MVGVLKVKHKNRRIRIQWSEAWIRGSESVPKCRGSTILVLGLINVRVRFIAVLKKRIPFDFLAEPICDLFAFRCTICQAELLFSFHSIRKHIKRAHKLAFKDYEEKHADFTGQRPRKFALNSKAEPPAAKQQAEELAVASSSLVSVPIPKTAPAVSASSDADATVPQAKKAKSKQRAPSKKKAKNTTTNLPAEHTVAALTETVSNWPSETPHSGGLPVASDPPAASGHPAASGQPVASGHPAASGHPTSSGPPAASGPSPSSGEETSAPVAVAAAWYDGNRFECKKCDFATNSFNELSSHLALVHEASLEEELGGNNQNSSGSSSSPCYTKTSMMYQCHVCLAEIYHEKSAISYHLHTAHGLDLDTYGRSYVVKQEKGEVGTPPPPPPPVSAAALAVPAVISAAGTGTGPANQYNTSHHHQFLGIYNMYDPRAHHHQLHPPPPSHHYHPGLPDSGYQNGFVSPPAVPRDIHYERAGEKQAQEEYARQLERARQFERSFHMESPHHFRWERDDVE